MKKKLLYTKDLPPEAYTPGLVEDLIQTHTVADSECLVWSGTKDIQGRGMGYVHYDGDFYRVANIHRVIYQCFNGPIPKGKICMHICHNNSCVEKDHIIIGTHKQNMQMEKLKNLAATGKTYNGGQIARQTPRQREVLRQKIINGQSCYSISKEHNVSLPCVLWHKNYLKRIGRME